MTASKGGLVELGGDGSFPAAPATGPGGRGDRRSPEADKSLGGTT
ncbi:hypothetical protein [Acrocarpospora macrocephala]|nr:hypothetical protein [Acrocarpospora macrocephala]